MKLKFFLLLFFTFSFLTQLDAQRRTTSVKGYTRKDGTYVKPHTRDYNSGSVYSSYKSTSGGNYNSSYSDNERNSTDYKKVKNGQYLTYTSDYNGDKIEKSKLTIIQNFDKESEDGNIIYLSVLYYNGNVIDICPVSKNIINNWDFNNINHSIDKDKLTSEHALDLISNYQWSISKEKITKNFKYLSSYNNRFPS
ncbi:hypothetical protein CLU96_0849 [Chryseobacterium sp. 52]|uniref:hypothetical protein n=1 Tax=Chryseobacterium sp. 52 TaxID=2035213 RepID=UPI000C18029D|nr:hypothetical protein [Chryseobacterium sp. 52]PIF43925.1 hypothetical protein CLU96_0849 [Chryseobacterium sp. 52]